MRSPGFRDLIANVRDFDVPLATRIRLALRNTGIKLRQRTSCCGNPGELGC